MRVRGHVWRSVALPAAVMAQLAMFAPAAQATTTATVTFTGAMAVGAGGIAFPCMAGKPCPPPNVGVSAKSDPKGLPVANINPGTQNTATLALASTMCIFDGKNVNKPGKLPIEVGTCAVTAAGVETGYCGLGTGTLTGGIGPAAPLPNNVQNFTFNVKFTDAPFGTLTFTGTATKGGRTGNVHGTATYVVAAGTCLNKAAKLYMVTATLTIKILT